MKKIFFFLLLAISFQSFGQKISDMQFYNGSVEGVYIPTLVNGVNRKMLVADLSKSKVDSIVISNDSIFYYKNAGTRYFSGYISSGAQYSNGFGLNLTSNTFKADTNSIASRERIKKITDSLAPLIPATVRATLIRAIDDNTDKTSLIQAAFDAGVKEILFDEPASSVKATGTITIPTGRRLVFRNGAKLNLGSTGVLNGGTIDADENVQIFTATNPDQVKNIENREIYVKWFGAAADNVTDDLPAFRKALAASIDMYESDTSIGVYRSKIILPPGTCYLSNTWEINGSVEIAGGGRKISSLHFAVGNVGIWAKPKVAGDKAGLIAGNYWHDFTVYAGSYPDAYYDSTSHGIFIQTNGGVYERISVVGFNGNGVHVYGSTPVANANRNMLIAIESLSNAGSGFHLQGADGNKTSLIHCDATANGIAGYKDIALLGSYFDAPHSSANSAQNPFSQNAVYDDGALYFCIRDNGTVNGPTMRPGVTSGWENYWVVYNDDFGGPTTGFPQWTNSTKYYGGGGFQLSSVSSYPTVIDPYSEGDEYHGLNASGGIILGGINGGDMANAITTASGYITTKNMQIGNNESTGIWWRMLSEAGIAAPSAGFFDVPNSLFSGFTYYAPDKALSISNLPGVSGHTSWVGAGTNASYFNRTGVCAQGSMVVRRGLWFYNENTVLRTNLNVDGSQEPDGGNFSPGDKTLNNSIVKWPMIDWTYNGSVWRYKLAETQPETVSYAATITPNAGNSTRQRITLTGNATIAAPTNGTDGQTLEIELKQDGTGSRTVTWNAVYKFPDDFPEPTLSTAAGSRDKIRFNRNETEGTWDCIGYVLGYH